MQGQEFDVCDLPFDGYYAPQVERKPRHFGCPFSRHYDGRPGYPGYGRPGFDYGPEHQGPDTRGPQENGNWRHGWGRWGPPKQDSDAQPGGVLFHGPPPNFRPGYDGRPGFDGRPGYDGRPGFDGRSGYDVRPQEFHGHPPSGPYFGAHSWWFGRRGPSESAERPDAGSWRGPDYHRP